MQNLSREICLQLKAARQAKGLNQSALAQVLGCKQSAISMFEGGLTTKLSQELVEKMADFLGVKLTEPSQPPALSLPPLTSQVKGFCPNCACPSNIPYVVGDTLLFRPLRALASPQGQTHCVHCGELLEMRCPTCGAPLNDGACCGACGTAYVTPVVAEGTDVRAFASARCAELAHLRQLSDICL